MPLRLPFQEKEVDLQTWLPSGLLPVAGEAQHLGWVVTNLAGNSLRYTPAYPLFILGWWGVTDALPILRMEAAAGGGAVAPEAVPYVITARVLLGLVTLGFLWLIRIAWKRNRYDQRVGFTEHPSAEEVVI